MSVDVIQARYDELKMISARFRSQAEQSGQMQRSLQRAFQSLQSDGWKGRGAEAFFAEMQQDVFPALGRLRTALTTGDEVMREIVEIMRVAEQEAAAPFRGEHHGQHPPSQVEPVPVNPFEARRKQYILREPEEVEGYPFQTGPADATRYLVDIDGRRIPVYIAKVSHDGEVHSIHEVAKSLAALPESARSRITRVDLEPKRSPDDKYYEKEYKTPGFRSYAAAGRDGVVKVYPTWGKASQGQLDRSMHHEGGHIISQQEWGTNAERDWRWNQWKAAMKKDPGGTTTYATNSPHEDFAETYRYYHQIKGTPLEQSERKWLGERFKIIEQIEEDSK